MMFQEVEEPLPAEQKLESRPQDAPDKVGEVLTQLCGLLASPGVFLATVCPTVGILLGTFGPTTLQ